MIAILRAPELSATSRIDRIWIMTHAPRSSFSVRRVSFVRRTSNQEPRTTSSLDFDRFPHDPGERPPFAAAHRAGLDDSDHIAGLRFVLLVVDHELRRAPLGLAVQAVPHLPLDGHAAAPLHPVPHDHADFLRLFCHLNIPWREGSPSCLSCPFLSENCLHPGQVPSYGAQLVGVLELPHRLLDTHAEQLIGEIAFLDTELVVAEIAQFRGLHSIFSCANRVANRVRIGSLAAASFIASRASFSLIPSISNSTRPGRTTHTHCPGAPLPLPMRVSCGFLVIGLSGNTRTQIFPPRAIKRVIATRAASICRSVSQQGSSAFSP